MSRREKIWRAVLYGAAGVALVLGALQAVREQRLAAVLGPGTPPPAFVARRADGSAFDLASLRGKAVVLSFWATWCHPCRKELPLLKKLAGDYRARGLEAVAASTDDAGDREEALEAWRDLDGAPPSPVVFPDEATTAAWRAGTLPTLYVLGRDGQIVAGHSGLTSEATLRRDIEAALRGP